MSKQTVERIHVIRVQTPTCTIAMVTNPTTVDVDVLEADARQQYPSAVLKPSRSYEPAIFKDLEEEAEEVGLSIDEVIDRRETAHPPAVVS